MNFDLGRYTDDGRPFTLPASTAIQRFAFLAKSGAGKTYCGADLAEEMLKNGVPIIVIDPMGIWWGLRKAADGRSDGYPVVVFGGDHGDLPLDTEKAQDLARAIVESNISAVIDVAELSHGALQRFIPPFLEELRHVNVEDRHIFIEEADVIAPQKPGPDETRCLGAVDVFVRRGGNKNLGTTLISQRSAVVNKNVLTQSDFLVVLRTTAPQDKDAVAAWAVAKSADKKELNAWLDSLAKLKNGEAYVWGELPGAGGEVDVQKVKIQFRERETFHATRENLKRFKGVKPMAVDEFVAKFSKIFEKGEAREERVRGGPIAIGPLYTAEDDEDWSEFEPRLRALEEGSR
jgi:DNA helicase HerA-like ATPase